VEDLLTITGLNPVPGSVIVGFKFWLAQAIGFFLVEPGAPILVSFLKHRIATHLLYAKIVREGVVFVQT